MVKQVIPSISPDDITVNPQTKGQINRLGDRIRQEFPNINEGTLLELQDYRTSHKQSLSGVFNTLCTSVRKVNKASIVTYRIKRFESIIGKLNRYEKMQFSRMWDIGGCRCIMWNDGEVYRLKEEIGKVLEIRKEYDYIETPQKDGYKSLHLFVSEPGDNKVIEVQIRNQKDHNWATLVEITDILFDAKLKEFGKHKGLLRFHFLLSKYPILSREEKKETVQLIRKYKYFDKLSEVFSRNYLKVREQWMTIENDPKHRFFLIETTKDEIPKILAFQSFDDAESQYFNLYKTNTNANIVLTHLHRPSYKQITVAYSNYLLSVHTFMDDCSNILKSLIVESVNEGKYIDFVRYFGLFQKITLTYFTNVFEEIRLSNELTITSKKKRSRKSIKKEREWEKDIKRQIESRQKTIRNLQQEFTKNPPRNYLDKVVFKRITRSISKKYNKKLQKMLDTTIARK